MFRFLDADPFRFLLEIRAFSKPKSLKSNFPVVLFYLAAFPALTQLIYRGYENLGMTEWLPMVGLTAGLVFFCGWPYAVFLIPARMLSIYLNLGQEMDFFLNLVLVSGTAVFYGVIGWAAETFLQKSGGKLTFRNLLQVFLLVVIGVMFVPGVVFQLLEASGYPFFKPTIHLVFENTIGSLSGILHLMPFLVTVFFPGLVSFARGTWKPPGWIRGCPGLLRTTAIRQRLLSVVEFLLLGFLLAVALQPSLSESYFGDHGLVYFAFLPVIWVSLNYPWAVTVVTVFFVDTLIIFGAAFAEFDFFGPYELQILVISISLVGYVLGLISNEQRLLVRLLHNEEDKYRSVVHQTAEGIVLADLEGEVLEWNSGMEAITGLPAPEAIGRNWRDVCSDLIPEGVAREQPDANYETCSSLPELQHFTGPYHLILTPRHDTAREVQVNASPVHAETQSYVVLVIRDVTDEMEMQRALAESEERFRGTVEWAHEGIVLCDAEGLVVEWNRGFERLLSVERKAALGRPLRDLVRDVRILGPGGNPLDLEKISVPGLMNECSRQPITDIVSQIIKPDGSTFHVKWNVFLLTTRLRQLLCLVASDVTELAEQEIALRRYSQILGAVSDLGADLLEASDISSSLHSAAEILGNAIQADRVRIDRFLGNRECGWSWRVEECWFREDQVPEQIEWEQGQNFDSIPFPGWKEELSAGRMVEGCSESLPEAERDRLKQHGVQSVLIVPLFCKGVFWGALTFLDDACCRSWMDVEKSALRTAAGILGSALQKHEAENELQRRNTDLLSLNSVMAAVTQSLEIPELLRILQKSLKENLDTDGGMIILDEFQENELDPEFAWGVSSEEHDHILQMIRPRWEDLSREALPAILDPEEPPGFNGALRSRIAVIPLRAGRDVLGMVVVVDRAGELDESRILFLSSLGQQVETALQNAYLMGELQRSRERLRELSGQVIHSQETERRRVARELHDEAGQALTALKIGLELLQAEPDLNLKSSRERLEESVELADATMEQIRLLARDLRPPELEALGLSRTLENTCSEFGRRTGLTVEYRGVNADEVGDSIAVSLYRFLQEALTNVARHAYATSVGVDLAVRNGKVFLEVEDDGCGFNVQAVLGQQHDPSGMGLTGMGERLELIGGNMWITSIPAQGTKVIAEVPWRPNA